MAKINSLNSTVQIHRFHALCKIWGFSNCFNLNKNQLNVPSTRTKKNIKKRISSCGENNHFNVFFFLPLLH